MIQHNKIDDQAFYYDPSLWKVKEYVDRHYPEPLSLEAVAKIAGLESADFSELFHDKTGIRFDDWLSSVRVIYAIELMAHGDRPLTEQSLKKIALEVGFGDLSTFERAVEKFTGRTPRSEKSSLRLSISS